MDMQIRVKFIHMHELSFATQGFLWASKTWNINFCEHQPWTQSEKLSKYVKLRLSPFVKVSDLLLKYSKFYPRKTLFLTSRWDLTFSLVLTMSTGFLSDNKHQNFNLKFVFNLNPVVPLKSGISSSFLFHAQVFSRKSWKSWFELLL